MLWISHNKEQKMIDISRRDLMKLMAILGIGTVVGSAAPVRLTLKERKRAFDERYSRKGQGYYGFGETW